MGSGRRKRTMSTSQPSFDPLRQPLEGVHSIEASAGTGKTFSITLLWLRLLIEQRLRVDQVLVTTFTRAATAELKERLLVSLRRALQAARNGESVEGPEAKIVAGVRSQLGTRDLARELEAALSSFDLAPIHTIHGFCQSLISRHTLELGCDPGLELSSNADELLEDIVGDELMRHAEQRTMSHADALRVAKAVVSEPLGRLLLPVASEQVAARSQELINPLLQQVGALTIPAKSLAPIVRKLEALRDSGKTESLSQAQLLHLTPIRRDLEEALEKVKGLYRALEISKLHPIATVARAQYPLRKSSANLRTFDDILLTVHQALTSQGNDSPLVTAIGERFKAAIVDECQDSDSIQIDVFLRLFAKAASFVVIGDPKQSIYRFRGADLSSYQQLSAGAARAADMTTNYRSDRPLVEALNRLYLAHPKFRGGTREHPIRYIEVTAAASGARIADRRATEPLLLLWSDATDRDCAKRELAQQTADEFRRLLDEGVTVIDRDSNAPRPVCASDFAVLATSHKDLSMVRRELLARNIPCEQAGESLGVVWTSDEAADVQSWLQAVEALEERADPLAAMLAFASTPLVGFTASELHELRDSPAKQAILAQRLLDDCSLLQFQGPLPILQRYWSDLDRLEARLGCRDGERRVTNWRQLGCLLQSEWATGRARAGELSLWLARKRGKPDDDSDGTLMKLETDMPAVQLATIYSAKGLEYPIVSCPFLWSVKSRQYREKAPFAIVRRPEETIVDVGSSLFGEHLGDAINQEEEEQERLLYVALTRARHRVYLGLCPVESSPGHSNGAERSALAVLLGLDKRDKDDWSTHSPVARLMLEAGPDGQAVTTVQTQSLERLASPPLVESHRGPLTRCSSYSGLTRSADAAAKDHDPEERDVGKREPGLLGGVALTGNRLGQRVHNLLEDILGNGRTLDDLTASLEPALHAALSTILATPLPLGDQVVTLAQVQPRAIAEMHALLPVHSITPAGLSHAMLADPLIAEHPDRHAWAEGIAEWSFGTLAGFFQGYIDLIFEHGGRWYIVDYKTNALPGYDPASLETAMLHHHYVLQARIYTVCLHRHLKATLPGYDPGTHLGGCAYLFVRGFPQQGVWFERTAPASVAALDALFAEASS